MSTVPATVSDLEAESLIERAEPQQRVSARKVGIATGVLLFAAAAVTLGATRLRKVTPTPPRGLASSWESWPNGTTSYDDPSYRNLMLQGCGEICDTTILGTPSKFFNETRKSFDCMDLYRNRFNDAPAPVWPSPRDIPESLLDDFTTNGRAVVKDWYLEERYSGTTGMQPTWTIEEIEGMKALALQNKLPGNYGWPVTSMIWSMLQKHAHLLRGRHAFVIGSETPWLESQLLAIGASHVTTIEYGTIVSQHPNVTTMTPAQVTRRFLESNGQEPKFDVAVTFSSLEHSGLGRYGDTLNPWGDLQAVAKAWCITRSGGSMFLGLPASRSDEVCWDAHRSYGLHRWPHLMANYRQIDEPAGGMWRDDHPEVMTKQWKQPCQFFQPMVVFERMDAPASGSGSMEV